MNRLTKVVITGIIFFLLACSFLLLVSKLNGPRYYDVRVGRLSETNQVFTITAPNGWLAGFAITTELTPMSTEQSIEVELTLNDRSFLSNNVTGKQLIPCNWIRGSGYVLPIQWPKSSDFSHQFGYGAKIGVSSKVKN